MNNRLSEATISIIKNSAELITQNDIKISMKMYEFLFSKYPELEKLFENKSKDQYMRLAEALSAYAVNIDKIERLKPALHVISESHVEANIKPSHYPMVGMALIEAIEHVLGDKATLEFVDAWREAYKFVAEILIEIEQDIYDT